MWKFCVAANTVKSYTHHIHTAAEYYRKSKHNSQVSEISCVLFSLPVVRVRFHSQQHTFRVTREKLARSQLLKWHWRGAGVGVGGAIKSHCFCRATGEYFHTFHEQLRERATSRVTRSTVAISTFSAKENT